MVNKMDVNILKNKKVKLSQSIAIKGENMTANSKILENFRPPYSASIINIFNQNDISFEYNQSNYYEFDIKPVFNSFTNIMKFDKDILNLSLDFSGMPRLGAFYNGAYSYKPTYGTFSRFGVAAVANSFEQINISSSSYTDIYSLARLLAKKDEKDQNSKENKSLIEANMNSNKKSIKIAVFNESYGFIEDEDLKNHYLETIDYFNNNSFIINGIDCSILESALMTHIILSNIEISSNMARYDSLIFGKRSIDYNDIEEMYGKSRQEGFGLDIKSRIILGNYLINMNVRRKYYDTALANRDILSKTISELFNDYDLILLPTSPISCEDYKKLDSLIDLFRSEIYTSLANLTGNPVLQIPFNNYGFQVLTSKFKDADLFKFCKLIEETKNEF